MGAANIIEKDVQGDKSSSRELQARSTLEIELAAWGAPNPDVSDNIEFTDRTTWRTNYGKQVIGPWVVGVYKSKCPVRFIIVPDRSEKTLRKVIERHCESSRTLITDGWGGYNRLCENRYDHRTVNHSKLFVNLASGTQTQGIERMWVDGKAI